MNGNALSLLAPVRPDRVDELKKLLNGIGEDINGNPLIPFARLKTVHFMRWVVLDATTELDGQELPPALVAETNYDGPLAAHLQELCDVAGEGLRTIYGHCADAPDFRSAAPDALLEYLSSKRIPVAAFYVGARAESAARICAEDGLRRALEAFLDERLARLPQLTTERALHAEIRDFIAGQPALAWALRPDPAPSFAERLSSLGQTLRSAAALLLLLPLVLVGLPIWLPWLVYREVTDPKVKLARPHGKTRGLLQREDQVVQNQLTHLVAIKPGLLRKLTLRAVLYSIDKLARYVFNKGSLGGIPTIHFARWMLIDNGRRLLFFSNFDGSWESYLGDFVDKAASGLTAVWSNTREFPETRLLVGKGARDEEQFKLWTRKYQIPTQVWYSAYPHLSIRNVIDGREIREGLATATPSRPWTHLL